MASVAQAYGHDFPGSSDPMPFTGCNQGIRWAYSHLQAPLGEKTISTSCTWLLSRFSFVWVVGWRASVTNSFQRPTAPNIALTSPEQASEKSQREHQWHWNHSVLWPNLRSDIPPCHSPFIRIESQGWGLHDGVNTRKEHKCIFCPRWPIPYGKPS